MNLVTQSAVRSLCWVLGFLLLTSLEAQATIWTVSNNPLYRAQYNSLASAQTAASVGDTLLISGSPISYGDFLLGKKLILIGAGYNNPNGENSLVDEFKIQNTGASGSRIFGLDLDLSINAGYQLVGYENIHFVRCRLRNMAFTNSAKKIVFSNCLISGSLGGPTAYPTNQDSIVINNSILDSIAFNPITDVIIRNSLLIGQTGNYFNNYSNSIVVSSIALENSIVTAGNLDGCNTCIFLNNIIQSGVVLDTTVSVVAATDNLFNTDPLFTNYPGGTFDFTHNYNLQVGSPGINAGWDGTDIGISGGALPFEVGANPPIPQMIYLNLPQTSIPINGTLQFDFKAKTQN